MIVQAVGWPRLRRRRDPVLVAEATTSEHVLRATGFVKRQRRHRQRGRRHEARHMATRRPEEIARKVRMRQRREAKAAHVAAIVGHQSLTVVPAIDDDVHQRAPQALILGIGSERAL